MRNVHIFAVCALLFSCIGAAAQAAPAPVIGPAIVRNGVRFETWLASPQIVIPDKRVGYDQQTARVLFSVRVTNLTQTLMRFNPFGVRLILTGPDGAEVGCGFVIGGYVRQPDEKDYLLLKPGQSIVLQYPSFLYWYNSALCLDWPSHIIDHPWNYGGLVAGSYHFTINCSMTAQSVQLRDEHIGKVVKTLGGFWVGDVTLPPLTFQLVKPSD